MSKVTSYVMPSDKGEMASTPSEQFGRRVRELMLKKGWTQTELSRRMASHMPDGQGVDRQLISAYIVGRHLPQQKRLEAIAKALEVEPYDLVRSPLVEWIGSGVAPGGSVNDALRQPPGGPVQAAAREGSPALALDVQGGQARLRVDQMVPLDIAMQIMGLLTASAKH